MRYRGRPLKVINQRAQILDWGRENAGTAVSICLANVSPSLRIDTRTTRVYFQEKDLIVGYACSLYGSNSSQVEKLLSMEPRSFIVHVR